MTTTFGRLSGRKQSSWHHGSGIEEGGGVGDKVSVISRRLRSSAGAPRAAAAPSPSTETATLSAPTRLCDLIRGREGGGAPPREAINTYAPRD